jgi:hypothetical protein
MPNISQARIAILATNGFEQSELEVPLTKLREAGAKVDVVSPESGEIKGWDHKDWGRPVKVDKKLDSASPDDYDAIVLPVDRSTRIYCGSMNLRCDSSSRSSTVARSSLRCVMRRGF